MSFKNIEGKTHMSQDSYTITDRLNKIASRFPKRTAIQVKKDDKWQTLTFEEFHSQSLQIAYFLLAQGLQKGERVSILLENRHEWGIIYTGIMHAGLTCVPLDIQSPEEHIEQFINDSETKVIFCSIDIFENKFSSSLQKNLLKIVIIEDSPAPGDNQRIIPFSQIINNPSPQKPLPGIAPEDIASLIYTSGTTEKPKGVLLTHKNICANVTSIQKMKIIRDTDNFMSLLPLHHTYPFMVTLMLPLCSGSKITYGPPGFKPQHLANIMKEGRVTILQGVPQFFSLLHSAISQQMKKIPSFLRSILGPIIRHKVRQQFGGRLRLLVGGGARLDARIGRELTQFGLNFTEGYGLTETSPVATLNPPRKVKFGSVGKPIPNVQIKIDQPDQDGIGEVLIKGPNVMAGYFRRPELTQSVIKEGWFHSGDLGYIDKQGYLFLTGRGKEVIVLSSGKNINPDEIEELYCQSAYIKELCIFPKREQRFGQEVESLQAVIVPDFDQCRFTQEGNIQAKIRWELENIARDLPPYKHIMGFILTKEELPRTALKKLKRYAVEEKYLKQAPPEEEVSIDEGDFEDLDPEITKKVIGYLCDQLHRSVGVNNHLEIDLGIDSLSRVEMGLGLEKLLSVSIPDEDLGSISTVKELIAIIFSLRDSSEKPGRAKKLDDKTWAHILQQPPNESIRQKIQTKMNFGYWLFAVTSKIFILTLFRIIWLLRIRKTAPLPNNGPCIVCANHASYLDGPVIMCSLPFQTVLNTYFLGYTLIFEHPLIRWVMKPAHLVSIDASVRLMESMQTTSYILSKQKIVCIFPEAERTIDNQVKKFRKGVGVLVKELNVPVIPAYIKGSYHAWRRGNRFPRPYPMKVTFGRPFTKEELLEGKSSDIADDYEAIAQRLREEVIKLKDQ